MTRSDIFSVILPGMAVMFLLFIVQTVMRDMISEREDGKLRRMLTTPLRPGELLGARIAGGWLMGFAVLVVMAVFGTLVFRASWGSPGYFLLLAAVTAFWTASFFALLNAFLKNRNQAGAVSAPVILASASRRLDVTRRRCPRRSRHRARTPKPVVHRRERLSSGTTLPAAALLSCRAAWSSFPGGPLLAAAPWVTHAALKRFSASRQRHPDHGQDKVFFF